MTFDRETGVYEALRKELRKFTPLPVRANRRRGEASVRQTQRLGRGVPTIFVAASNASDESKDNAHLVVTGTTDDTILKEASARLPAGGGNIELSEGTFNDDGEFTVDKSKVTIKGQGWNTIIKATSTMTLMIDAAVSLTDIVIRDLKFDGNSLATSAMFEPGKRHKILNVEVANCTDPGIRVGDNSGIRESVLIEGCWSHDNTGHGFDYDADSPTVGILTNCSSTNNGGDGFHFGGTISNQGLLLANCTSQVNAGWGVGLNSDSVNVLVSGCTFRLNTLGTFSHNVSDSHNLIDGVYTPGDHTDAGGVSTVGLSTADFSDGRDPLATGAGSQKWVAPVNLDLNDVVLAVATSPTGAALIVDVNKNGTTIFTTQANRPTVPAGDADGVGSPAVPDVTTMTAGEYLTVDIDQIGSTVAGGELTVVVEWQPT